MWVKRIVERVKMTALAARSRSLWSVGLLHRERPSPYLQKTLNELSCAPASRICVLKRANRFPNPARLTRARFACDPSDAAGSRNVCRPKFARTRIVSNGHEFLDRRASRLRGFRVAHGIYSDHPPITD